MAGIRAHCRACHYSIYLTEFVRSAFLETHCPSCGRDLAENDPHRVRREAARAVRAHDDLVESVRFLVNVRGNLELVPHTLVRELFEEVDWRHDEIVEDRELIEREVEALERYLETLSELVDSEEEGQEEEGQQEEDRRRQLRDRLRRLSPVLRRFAGVSDGREEEQDPVSRPGG